ncbi:hypothetical protein PRIC1_003848 [Phytophthora ramorum]
MPCPCHRGFKLHRHVVATSDGNASVDRNNNIVKIRIPVVRDRCLAPIASASRAQARHRVEVFTIEFDNNRYEN